ncbi:MAG TPA: response regulator [Caulobacteraceae bacterium]|nr:response regulator [Caulobacteraceae bacterium]
MSGQFSSLKVLLADDNAHLRAIVAAILSGIGVPRVQECSDGAQALDCLRRGPIDVAIVDFHMAPVDGVEFTHLVRNSPDSVNPELPIIMLTGYAERARVCEARDAGVTEFIVKPVAARAVYDRLNAVVFRPRPFIKCESYHGPCRRRRQDPGFQGPFRRSTDARASAKAQVFGDI